MSQNKFATKFQGILDKYFHKIFNNSHFFYTIIFFILALIIALLSLIPATGDFILFLSIVIAITFILLMFEGLVPQLEKYLFSSEKKFDKKKIICFAINFFISFILILVYFLLAHSTKITIPLLGWDIILPFFLIIIYFGWNLTQILYMRIGFEGSSTKLEDKINDKFGFSKRKDSICFSFLILAICVPILLQLATFFIFLSSFSQGDPLAWYIGCNVLIIVLIFVLSWRLITLYQRSKKNNTPNVFASMFYILIWIVIWFRTISFLNSLSGILQASTEAAIVSNLIDIILMVFTSIMVLRSLGAKVHDSVLFNQNNMPLFLFSFVMLYIEGQIIMITGAGTLSGIFADKNQIGLITNLLIISVTAIFYWWYSERSLERKGLIVRKRYNSEEVALVVNDFREFLINKNALDTNRVGDEDVHDFLLSKNIAVPLEKPVETDSEPEINKDLSGNQE